MTTENRNPNDPQGTGHMSEAGRTAENGRLDVSEAGSGTTLLRVVDRAFVSGDAL